MTASHAPIDQGITWSFAPLDHLRLMRAKYVNHSFAPHAHDYYVLGIIEEGVQTFTHGRAYHVTTPGKIIVINPGEIHTGEPAVRDGFAYRALYPTPALMERCLQAFQTRAGGLPQFHGGTVQDIQLYDWIQQLHRLSEHPAHDPLALEENLIRFFTELIQRHSAPAPTLPDYQSAHRAVMQVRDLLETHYAQPITLSQLADQVYITPYHLARLFTKHMGMPPHRYLENVRIRHAERLLTHGASIADAAYATGFSSQSHFTRTFKRFIGTTPGSFLKNSKIVQDTPVCDPAELDTARPTSGIHGRQTNVDDL